MKFLILVFFLGLFNFFIVPATYGSGFSTIASATLPIVGLSTNGKAFKTFGSGFVFQWKRRIITTATVIDSVPAKYLIPESRLGVLTNGGSKGMAESNQFHTVKVTFIDREKNIALLETNVDLSVTPLQRVSQKTLKAGDLLSVSGWTGKGLVQTYFEGCISFVTSPYNGTPSFYSLAFPVGTGATGGPVFNRKSGDLEGILQIKSRFVAREVYPGDGAIGESLGSAIVIPVKTLLKILEEQKK